MSLYSWIVRLIRAPQQLVVELTHETGITYTDIVKAAMASYAGKLMQGNCQSLHTLREQSYHGNDTSCTTTNIANPVGLP